MFQVFSPKTQEFLWGIRLNNDRGWFETHKQEYLDLAAAPLRELGEEAAAAMEEEFPKLGLNLHVSRIYRDARRLHGRGPYKDHLWFTLRRPSEGWTARPAFYFEIAPEYCGMGMGCYDAAPEIMARLRARIDRDPKPLEKLARLCGNKDEFRVGTTGKAIVFLKENFAYSARLLEGEYIDAEGLIGSIRNQFTVLTGVQELRRALDSASCVDADAKICLRFEGQRLTFCCRSEHGNTAIPLDVIPLTGMPQGEYWYISKQLMACLRALSGTVKLGVAQSNMLTLETDDAYYLQTGVRPGAEAAQKKEKKRPAKKAA